ncbi:hypothetical protein Q9Q94_10235 [Uliginosibacterium sp. 31-16]|uniref:hypothetical protein n=1 Tax=Uliginosibacterium sp. 31-16 TaxID=3068315 RepID=UPI00273E8A7C|nr:hypothetical protein [Uliginosibacterium sp. 31-16]MDP5239913.1 hypothetical protein [Uliginosibacterium sp. 31-16]
MGKHEHIEGPSIPNPWKDLANLQLEIAELRFKECRWGKLTDFLLAHVEKLEQELAEVTQNWHAVVDAHTELLREKLKAERAAKDALTDSEGGEA